MRITEPESNRYRNISDTSHILSHASLYLELLAGGPVKKNHLVHEVNIFDTLLIAFQKLQNTFKI